jgi:hypothetical protein
MSRILKRPMFRIGGSANEGIMSMAAPRKNYQEGSTLGNKVSVGLEQAEENARFFEKICRCRS